MDNIEYLDLNEAADLLKLKPNTMYNYTFNKKIPHYKPFGRKLYFRKDELMAIIGSHKIDVDEDD